MMWSLGRRKTTPSQDPLQTAVKAVKEAHLFNDDINVIVEFSEVLKQVNAEKMSNGLLPTLDDLPFPIERIEQAINRCLKSSEIPDDLKKIAQVGQQVLQLFEMGSNRKNTEPNTAR